MVFQELCQRCLNFFVKTVCVLKLCAKMLLAVPQLLRLLISLVPKMSQLQCFFVCLFVCLFFYSLQGHFV